MHFGLSLSLLTYLSWVRYSYRKLARHFGWAFETIFKDQRVSNIVVLEDDLEVAPDFFAYFSALIPVLRADPTLWSVSAWSDNGQQRFVDGGNSAEVLRSDFFPGLGWVLTRELWSEFGGNHASFAPGGYWDDWMREPAQRKGRQVLRPEVGRLNKPLVRRFLCDMLCGRETNMQSHVHELNYDKPRPHPISTSLRFPARTLSERKVSAPGNFLG